MSDLSQFKRNSLPIGSQLLSIRRENLITEADGSVWYNTSPESPFTYTANYSYIPDQFIANHPLLTGPEPDGGWQPRVESGVSFNVAYNSSGSLYVTPTYGIDSGGNYYYTSTDGSTWTKRYQPNSVIYEFIHFTSGRFIMSISLTATNAFMVSTDGINWIQQNAPGANQSICDFIADDSFTNVIALTTSSSLYSGNGGNTWSSITGTVPTGSFNRSPGLGQITWNAGLGLFLVPSFSFVSGGGPQYLTSPTGQTWTARTPRSYTSLAFASSGATRMVSNSTTTLAISGQNGVYASTSDGLTWSNYGKLDVPQNSATVAYHDGTRFVVKFDNIAYYSTDLTNWTKTFLPLTGTNGGKPGTASSGVLFIINLYNSKTKILRVSDITSTTKQTVWPGVKHFDYFNKFNLYIKVK